MVFLMSAMVVRTLSEIDSAFEPGTDWAYSNTGFNLAAIIVVFLLEMAPGLIV